MAADPRKLRKGQKVKVHDPVSGELIVGRFQGIIPARPNGRDWQERTDRLNIRNGDLIAYVPILDGTSVKLDRS